MIYLDLEYLHLLSPQLRNFKKKSEFLVQCSCPICGDSEKDKTKARGFFFKKDNNFIYKCHNCSVSLSFPNFLKHVNSSLYDEYIFHKYKTHTIEVSKKLEKPKLVNKEKNINLPTIESLNNSHYAKKYISSRKIPEKAFNKIYFAEHFGDWVRHNIGENYKNTPNDDRIVFPFYDIDGNLIAAQGRSITSQNKLRYVTVKKEDTEHIVFGLDSWNKFESTYIVEGPIDSFFLPNALAVATSDLRSIFERLPTLEKNKTTLVFDNEPHNKEICDLMKKAMELEAKICFWPKSIKFKDINDMIMNNLTQTEILDIINKHTKSGLNAKLDFAYWKRF